MPNSKRRKRLVASNKKQLERARRRIEAQNEAEANKENATSTTTTTTGGFLRECRGSGKQISSESIEGHERERHRSVDQQSDVYESTSGPGWFGGLYNWCHSGLAQVGILLLVGYYNFTWRIFIIMFEFSHAVILTKGLSIPKLQIGGIPLSACACTPNLSKWQGAHP